MAVTIDGTNGITNVNGSASTPAETGTDTDTGIYYGTNTVSLATGGTQRLTIDSSGNVGIGTASPTVKLTIVGNGSAIQLYYDVPSIRFASTPNRTNNWYIGANISDAVNGGFIIGTGADINSGTARLTVGSDGSLKALDVYSDTVGATNRDLYIDNTGLLGYVSSIRASKTNIADITDVSWLYQLNPVSYQYRKKDANGNYTDEADGPIDYGLIAEDTEPVRPELCFYDDVGGEQELRGINYSKLIVPMLKAIQELKAEFDAYKAAHP